MTLTHSLSTLSIPTHTEPGQATMEAEKAGVSAPFGFFDPLGFYKGKTIRQKKKLRECESFNRLSRSR